MNQWLGIRAGKSPHSTRVDNTIVLIESVETAEVLFIISIRRRAKWKVPHSSEPAKLSHCVRNWRQENKEKYGNQQRNLHSLHRVT
jgi:hypothetical protein